MANKQNIPVALLQCNEGQIEGLPRNPRFIKDERFKALVKSLQDDPEMLDLRELIVYPHGKKYVVIGGNMRLRAGKELNFETMPCKILKPDTPLEKLKRYAWKDNIAFGSWDFGLLASEWDAESLEDCGFDFGNFFDDEGEQGVRKAWERGKKKTIVWGEFMYNVAGKLVIVSGRAVSKCDSEKTLGEEKNEGNKEEWSDRIIQIIKKIGFNYKDYTLVSAPSRRNKEYNFAEQVALRLADKLGIEYEKCFECTNRDRLNPIIRKIQELKTKNIILYDDIISTGNTIRSCLAELPNKNVIVVANIKNF